MVETKSTQWRKYISDIHIGFQKTKVLFVTTELKLYDLLESEGRMTASEIAYKKQINADATERILDYAAGLQLIHKNPETNPATYSNIPEVADVLQSHKPNNLVAAITHSSRIEYPLFHHLMTAIKDGDKKQAYTNTFGFEVTAETFASLYSNDKEFSATFLQYMHHTSSITAPGIAKSFDLSPFSKICDLGGGSGALAYALASEYPDASVTVFELAPAVAAARNITPDETERHKVKFVAGDFLKDEFPQANLYAFARIIHDWEEDKVNLLLEKTFQSLTSGGAVLIAEILLNETKTGPLYALRYNVLMFIEMGGRERTEKEYRQLLEQHGFVDFKCESVKGHDSMHVMLAYKP